MVSIRPLVEGSEGILREYHRVTKPERAKSLWLDWPSDWEHGQDWQILPVYASDRICKKRYGNDVDWEWITVMLSGLWPSIWTTLFKAIDPDKVELAAFSRLRANQELPPHEHINPGHLILHIGVDIPEGDVGIMTSYGTHQWKKPNEWVLFDDNDTHSAWNRTDEDRVIFYVDFIP